MPVCAPRLAQQLKRPADLKGPSLLRVAHSPDDWPLWLKAAGVARVTARGPEFQFYGQALQAAADGLGIAMGIRPYIDDDLAAGRLVAPFALTVPKGMRWYLVYRSFQTEQRDFAAFRRWIMRSAAGPAARTRPTKKPDVNGSHCVLTVVLFIDPAAVGVPMNYEASPSNVSKPARACGTPGSGGRIAARDHRWRLVFDP